jgi:hypothetical protein
LQKVWADLDGVAVISGQVVDLHTLALGSHTLTVYAIDKAYNQSSLSVTFNVDATIQRMMSSMYKFYGEGKFTKVAIYKNLYNKLSLAQAALNKGQNKLVINHLNAFINEVQAQTGKSIDATAATVLITDAQYVIGKLK